MNVVRESGDMAVRVGHRRLEAKVVVGVAPSLACLVDVRDDTTTRVVDDGRRRVVGTGDRGSLGAIDRGRVERPGVVVGILPRRDRPIAVVGRGVVRVAFGHRHRRQEVRGSHGRVRVDPALHRRLGRADLRELVPGVRIRPGVRLSAVRGDVGRGHRRDVRSRPGEAQASTVDLRRDRSELARRVRQGLDPTVAVGDRIERPLTGAERVLRASRAVRHRVAAGLTTGQCCGQRGRGSERPVGVRAELHEAAVSKADADVAIALGRDRHAVFEVPATSERQCRGRARVGRVVGPRHDRVRTVSRRARVRIGEQEVSVVGADVVHVDSALRDTEVGVARLRRDRSQPAGDDETRYESGRAVVHRDVPVVAGVPRKEASGNLPGRRRRCRTRRTRAGLGVTPRADLERVLDRARIVVRVVRRHRQRGGERCSGADGRRIHDWRDRGNGERLRELWY